MSILYPWSDLKRSSTRACFLLVAFVVEAKFVEGSSVEERNSTRRERRRRGRGSVKNQTTRGFPSKMTDREWRGRKRQKRQTSLSCGDRWDDPTVYETLCLPSDEYVGREMPHALNIYRARTRASNLRVWRRARSQRKEGHQRRESTREKKWISVSFSRFFRLGASRGCGGVFALVHARQRKNKIVSLRRRACLPSSSLARRRKELEEEPAERNTLGKTLPQRNRFVNLSWPGPLHPVQAGMRVIYVLSENLVRQPLSSFPPSCTNCARDSTRDDVGNKRYENVHPESDVRTRPPFTVTSF